MRTIAILTASLLLGGCSLGKTLQEVRDSPASHTVTLPGDPIPMARCTVGALDARPDLARLFVHTLQEDQSAKGARVDSFGSVLEYWVFILLPGKTTSFDLLFRPATPTDTAVEFRSGYPAGPGTFTRDLLPILQTCAHPSTTTSMPAPFQK